MSIKTSLVCNCDKTYFYHASFLKHVAICQLSISNKASNDSLPFISNSLTSNAVSNSLHSQPHIDKSTHDDDLKIKIRYKCSS